MWPGTWMTSCPEAMGWGFWNLKKNSELWFGLGRSKLIFGARRGQTSSLRRGSARGRVRCKSQHRKKLCLSLLISKNLKLKKVIKSFLPEPKKSHKCFVFFGFLYAFLHIRILVVFWDLYITIFCVILLSSSLLLLVLTQSFGRCILQPLSGVPCLSYLFICWAMSTTWANKV